MAWMDEDAVVLDNGTGMMKAGFAGAEEPTAVFPSCVGKEIRGDGVLVGQEAVDAKGYRLRYPVEHGIVNDWDGMSKVWRHAYKELDTEPEKQAVLVTEAPLNPKKNREKMLEILFEEFEVPALFVQIQAVLALYASGRNDGIVIDSGDGVTHTVPVYDGRVMPSAVKRLEIAGRDLTEWMMRLLSDINDDVKLTTSKHREWAKDIKESLTFLSDDFETDIEKWEEDPDSFDEKYTLPDGRELNLGMSKFACPEALFDPKLMDSEAESLPDVIQRSIWDCPIDCRKTLLSNIVLSGGTTLFKNMEPRLTAELARHPKIPPNARESIKVVSDSSAEGRNIRKYTVWMGGAILASLGTFQDQWISKNEYDELGVGIVHSRCNSLSGY